MSGVPGPPGVPVSRGYRGRPAPEPEPEHLSLGIPAYIHPLIAPWFWEQLAQAAGQIRFVIVNVHNGAGARVEPAYEKAIGGLREAKIRTLGYVDTDYARRPASDVIEDARAWVTRYGVQGVFFDQVASDFRSLEYYADCALGVRAAGAQFVVANPGNDCHPGLAQIANVLVTFEGTWADYQQHEPSLWMYEHPASRFCHLVYDVPKQKLADGPAEALNRHVRSAMFSDGRGANPWDRLPPELVAAAAQQQAPPPELPSQTYSWQQRRFAPAARPRNAEPKHQHPQLVSPPGPPGPLARLRSFLRPGG